MNKLLLSAFAACVATAAPTILWAQDHHDQHPPTGGGEHGGGGHPMGGSHTGDHSGMPHATYHHTLTHHLSTTHHTTHVVHEPTHAHIDVSTYHRNVTAERRFHYGEYRAPRGYEYRRWTYGERLPAEYFGQEYWISNYINFGLAWAPDGCEWVRFGPDALLVDIDTGEIVQVVYGVFY